MMKLQNSNLRVKGEKKRGQALAQKEVDKSLAKEAQLKHKIEDMDSFTFELAEKVRDADRKRRAAHKHAKHFKQYFCVIGLARNGSAISLSMHGLF